MLTGEQLRGAMFPLGETVKADVRAEAARRGLTVADKPDSHDICFVADGDTAGFLRERLGERPGEVVDESGQWLGGHDGVFAYTVGQRRGLGIQAPASDGRPRYVLDLQPIGATVTVGPYEALATDEVDGRQARWCAPVPPSPFEAHVQLRAHGAALPASVSVDGDRVVALLERPVHGIAPGQTLAVYTGTRVLGSATLGRDPSR